ncbi:MAG: purine-binding chemotaxis protein CheW, partial [Oligoflexia bacterium]|nr:purine-binding chemotaxis protein CheW [Oligoflexia bacterium]
VGNYNVDNEWKYLIYRLGGELYGSPLLSIKEVIKVNKIKPVPYTVPHYRGIISLRGNIIGIVDLRIKFGLSPQEGKYGSSVLIVENEEITIGALVDDVESVVALNRDKKIILIKDFLQSSKKNTLALSTNRFIQDMLMVFQNAVFSIGVSGSEDTNYSGNYYNILNQHNERIEKLGKANNLKSLSNKSRVLVESCRRSPCHEGDLQD